MPHLLLLEDDSSLIDGLAYALPKNGFSLNAFCRISLWSVGVPPSKLIVSGLAQ